MLRSVVLCIKVDIVRDILTLPSMRIVSDEEGSCRVCSFWVDKLEKVEAQFPPRSLIAEHD
jgi:hypothetical protein